MLWKLYVEYVIVRTVGHHPRAGHALPVAGDAGVRSCSAGSGSPGLFTSRRGRAARQVLRAARPRHEPEERPWQFAARAARRTWPTWASSAWRSPSQCSFAAARSGWSLSVIGGAVRAGRGRRGRVLYADRPDRGGGCAPGAHPVAPVAAASSRLTVVGAVLLWPVIRIRLGGFNSPPASRSAG